MFFTIAIETFLQECKHSQGEEKKKLTIKRSPEDEKKTQKISQSRLAPRIH